MKVSQTKNVRFSAVVDACGAPQMASLWAPPEKDTHFTRAIRENRVMTIKQSNVGTKKDFGVIGFIKGKQIAYLIFPKPLEAFRDACVIGIKYDSIQQAPVSDPVKTKATPPVKTRAKAPATHTYRVTVRTTATVDAEYAVAAANSSIARREAIQQAAAHPPAFAKAERREKVVGVKKV